MKTVNKAKPGVSVMGGRCGTAMATRESLISALGEPTYTDRDEDAKVTVSWVFKTPLGNAEVRDYWWNRETEWSIAAPTRRAAMHLAKYLRTLGFPASSKFYDAKACKAFNV